MVLWDQAIIAARAYPWVPRRQRYSESEDRAIAWAYRRGWTLTRIADQCRRHPASVQQHIARLIADGTLRRRPPLPGCRPWTAREQRYLQVHWGVLPDTEIATSLGRTVGACKLRATRVLHQSRRAAFLSARQTGRLLGTNEKTVLRWAAHGYVSVQRAGAAAGSHRQWSVSPRSLLRFLRAAPWLIPPIAAMPEPHHWLAQAARAAWEADPWLTISEVAAQVHYYPDVVRRWIVEEQLVSHQRRPHYGGQAGPWQGRVVIRQSEVAVLLTRHDALEDWRRHAAAVARYANRSQQSRPKQAAEVPERR